MFFTHEAGARFVYDAGLAKNINSNQDLLPLWSMYMMTLREMKLEEGGSLQDHIMKMMTCMNHLEYIDANFNKDLAVDVLLESLPESYSEISRRDYRYYERRTWIEMINLLRRYDESGAPARKRQQLAAEKAKKEKGIGIRHRLDPEVGPSRKVAKSYGWKTHWDDWEASRKVDESTASSPGTQIINLILQILTLYKTRWSDLFCCADAKAKGTKKGRA